MSYDPDFDYTGNVQRLGLVMHALASVDLDGITATTEMAHAIGPALDPTKYRDALYRGDMDDLAELAAALKPALKVWDERIVPKLTSAGASA